MKISKLINRLKSKPKDFTWNELKKVLGYYGYKETTQRGKSGGSRRKFVNSNNDIINLHEPHPEKTIKIYVIKQVIEHLKL